MAIKKLILGRNNDQTNLVFDKQVNIIDDLALSKELGTENIKNEDSTLIIKSMSDTQIADIIQIKINLTSVGTLLVNFNKEALTEDDRKAMFEALSALKNKEEPTEKTQTEKFMKILSIVEKNKPEYVTFLNKGTIQIDVNEVAKKTKWNFPLLILAVPPKQPSFFSKLKIFNGKYFKGDYLFCSIFALLASFALPVGLFQSFGGDTISILLFVLTAIFAGILCFICYQNLIPEKDKKLKFILMIYSVVGWVLGIVAAFVVLKLAFKEASAASSLMKILLIGGAGSLVLVEGVVWLVFPIKNIFKKK